MGLTERIRQRGNGAGSGPAAPAGVSAQVFHDLKTDLHRRVVDSLDLKSLEKLSPERLREQLRSVVGPLLAAPGVPLNQGEREQMVQELLDEITGLGPLEPLLRDSSISDILVNTYATVYIERRRQAGAHRPRASPTTTTCCASSTASSRGWAGASTSRRRWWTRACPTARA